MAFFLVVPRTIAENPVARAIAKRRIEAAIRSFLISCYLLEDGSTQAETITAAAKVLTVAIRLRERQGSDGGVSVMRGALSCCEQRSGQGFRWRVVDAAAIDAGMTAALDAVTGCSARELQEAWAFVERLERVET